MKQKKQWVVIFFGLDEIPSSLKGLHIISSHCRIGNISVWGGCPAETTTLFDPADTGAVEVVPKDGKKLHYLGSKFLHVIGTPFRNYCRKRIYLFL